MTARRSEYQVTLSEGQMRSPTPMFQGPTINVFADEISLTNTGDVVFGQIRQGAGIDEHGEIRAEKVMATVLVLRAGTFDSIAQVNKGGAEFYKESGLVELATH